MDASPVARLSFFEILRRLRELFSGMPIQDIWEILSALLALGTPPDVDAEDKLRDWLRQFGEILQDVAALTPTGFDDAIASFALTVVEDDDQWKMCYSVIESLLGDGQVDNELLASLAASVAGPGVKAFSPGLILMIIQAIVALYRILREEV